VSEEVENLLFENKMAKSEHKSKMECHSHISGHKRNCKGETGCQPCSSPLTVTMPANDSEGNPLQLNLSSIPPAVDILALAAVEVASQDESSQPDGVATKSLPHRPLIIYTRPQILHLQSSPLVKSPPHMPELKYWFGYAIQDTYILVAYCLDFFQ
jgi:hypothetical protein